MIDLGMSGVARMRSFATRIAETVTRTWVRLTALSFQPATKRPAKPVGRPPFTFFVIRTVTSPMRCRGSRARVVPPCM